MKIQLSDHFQYSTMIRFTLPSIVMMVFSSVYVIVDGLFVANYVGSNALAAINIFWPATALVNALGFMLAVGGNAEVAKTLGEGKQALAQTYFSMILTLILIIGITFTVFGVIFIRPICYLLGASEILIDLCVSYGRIQFIGITALLLQISFQIFFITAERPNLGLFFTIAAGVANMILDFVFVGLLGWGLVGASVATVIGYLIGGLIPFCYFLAPNTSLLKMVKPKFYPRVILHSAVNGSSEMVSNLSYGVVTFLYNMQMMKLIGEMGVAAFSVINYVNMVFTSVLFGFAVGIAPVIGFHYGAGNHEELQNLFKRCVKLIGIVAVFTVIMAQLFAAPITDIFCNGNRELEELTTYGFRIFSLAFLLCGFNIFGSCFFTSLCNGKISAIISFLRTFIMECGMILLLPIFMGVTGIFSAVPVTEVVTLAVTAAFIIANRKRYHYL